MFLFKQFSFLKNSLETRIWVWLDVKNQMLYRERSVGPPRWYAFHCHVMEEVKRFKAKTNVPSVCPYMVRALCCWRVWWMWVPYYVSHQYGDWKIMKTETSRIASVRILAGDSWQEKELPVRMNWCERGHSHQSRAQEQTLRTSAVSPQPILIRAVRRNRR